MERTTLADLEALRIFVHVVDRGSLSAAGRSLGIPKATLSRRLAELERSLGTALLRRTTRAQSLTASGRTLYERVAPLLAEAERAASEVKVTSAEPTGLVRVSAAVGFGQMVLIPIFARFMANVPKVRVDLSLSDEQAQIVGDGFDLAIRMGSVDESDLASRRLTRIERRVVASPAYVAANGAPTSIADIASHATLVANPRLSRWTFDTEGGSRDVHVRWRMATGNMMGLVEATELGLGIALLPLYMIDERLERGTLVTLDLGATPTTSDATALFPRTRTASPTVRRLLDFTIAELSAHRAFAPRAASKRERPAMRAR
jgi:DNA-binding transcriptional LysR family regulator